MNSCTVRRRDDTRQQKRVCCSSIRTGTLHVSPPIETTHRGSMVRINITFSHFSSNHRTNICNFIHRRGANTTRCHKTKAFGVLTVLVLKSRTRADMTCSLTIKTTSFWLLLFIYMRPQLEWDSSWIAPLRSAALALSGLRLLHEQSNKHSFSASHVNIQSIITHDVITTNYKGE